MSGKFYLLPLSIVYSGKLTIVWKRIFMIFLKGVFAKNERGCRLNAIKKRFWSPLILLLSVASVRRKLLKTTYTEECNVHTNWESCNTWLGSYKNPFNFKQINQILQPTVIDYFSTHFCIVNISYFLFVMPLKRRNSWPPGVSALDGLNDFTWQRQLAEKTSF